MKRANRYVGVAVALAAVVITFQQCSGSFKAADLSSADSAGGDNTNGTGGTGGNGNGTGNGTPTTPPLTDAEVSVMQAAFSRSFNGANRDRFYGMIATKDNNALVFGMTQSYGTDATLQPDALVMKLDPAGNRIFSYNLGMPANNDQYFGGREFADGSLIFTGLSRVQPPGVLDQVPVVKLAANGTFAWGKRFGTATTDDVAFGVAKLGETGVLVAGRSIVPGTLVEQAFVVGLNTADGTILYQKYLGGAQNDAFQHAVDLKNGDVLLLGYTNSYGSGGNDAWVTRMSAAGAVIWSRAVGGAQGEVYRGAVELPNGNLVLVGWSNTFGTAGDMMISLFQGDGTHVRTRVLGGAGPDTGASVIQTADGNLVVTGTSQAFGPTIDAFTNTMVAKLTPDLMTVMWSRAYGTAGEDRVDYANSIVETADRRLWLANYSSIDGQPVNDRTNVSVIKANGESGGTCMPSAAAAPVIATIAPIVTIVNPAETAGNFTVDTNFAAATYVHDLAAAPVGLCQ